MFFIYIILAYVQIVVNLRYTLRVFVQLYFLFFCYFFAEIVDNSMLLSLIRHNKEGHTRLVLTHPISGCLLRDKCLYSVERGSELEYNDNYPFHQNLELDIHLCQGLLIVP